MANRDMGQQAMETDDQFTVTLARGLQLLQAFSVDRPVLTNAELVQRCGLNKATVSRLAFTLIELGYLRRQGPRSGYALDTGVLELGYPLLASMQIRQIARPLMRALSERVHGTVSICVRDRDSIAYLDSARENEADTPLVDIGSTLPLVASAGGRAWLAAVSASECTAVLNRLRLQDPDFVQANMKEVEKSRASLLNHGFCINRGAHDARRVAVAVPMARALHGELIVFNCSLLVQENQRMARAREVGGQLRAMVRAVEVLAGLRPPPYGEEE
ncbi:MULTISPECIES: IclR family transcriptional regulator [Comamonas]|uniref:IclR family transcriptional regulator n=1 Tax=Comamonas TaxID=283 RepID=UPI0009EE444C|nr:IclR family transcriptional regulator [Comamonas thiooxydans]MCO8250892.1 IclR family transcriptional regulator [Comamonas thiooxydans]UBQ40797.1 IclR family transcriptional regulator [Comamonas thiooxydans]